MGIGDIQAVQARISQIQGMVATRLGGNRIPLGADSSTSFASALDRAQASRTVSATADGTAASRTKWGTDVLSALGMPLTDQNVTAMTAWARAEGTDAAFNPIATTQSSPGATNFNSVGVKNYASYEDGLAATVKTLTNGRYGNILAALQTGNDAEAVARAVADSPWGTGEGVLRVLHAGGA
ncbi:MAG: hypothetical protein U0V73_12190 [Acidimicrobiia bacterium]